MSKLTIKRDYSVIRDGEKIGSVCPAPYGWLAVDIRGMTDHYFPIRLQRDAARRVEVLFDRQAS